MPGLTDLAVRQQRTMGPLLMLAVFLGLIGLPLAVWLDLRSLSERLLRLQAGETSEIIDDMRAFYASDVVGRVLQAHGQVTTGAYDYKSTPGAIPIPATLSIELGKLISAHNGAVQYRFVSDLPFRGRERHPLDAFELRAHRALRADPVQPVVEVAGSLFDRQVRIATPVRMGAVCVACHNSHPDSPKLDWKVGDVRGIQEISVSQSLGSNLLAFKYLLLYFVLAAAAGLAFILMQRRQAGLIRGINQELGPGQRLFGLDLDEAGEIPVAADLQEHLQRPEGRRDHDRAQEADDLLLRHRELHRHHRTAAAGGADRAAQRVSDGDVADSPGARRHRRQVHRRRDPGLLRRSGDARAWRRTRAPACRWRWRCSSGWPAQLRMARAGHRAAVPRADRHQHRLLQRRQFRQRRPDGLHDHRRRGEPRGPAADASPSPTASSSATRPTRWSATWSAPIRCRRSR